jgi:hypothetical protein
MDFLGERGIGAANLARAQAGGNARTPLRLPQLKEYQVLCCCFVAYLSQRTTQCLGTRTILFTAVAPHQHPSPDVALGQLGSTGALRQSIRMTL